jgi:hypothetical protein
VARVVPVGRPRAGSRFAILVTVIRKESGEVVGRGRVWCRAKVGGRGLQATVHEFRRARAVCAWRIPLRTEGKRLAFTVGVRVGESRVRRSLAAVVASG